MIFETLKYRTNHVLDFRKSILNESFFRGPKNRTKCRTSTIDFCVDGIFGRSFDPHFMYFCCDEGFVYYVIVGIQIRNSKLDS